MSNDEAKFVLHAYRPGGHDANDAGMAPALQQVRQDPALGAWFAREQAHAAAVGEKLRAIAPPPGLRDAILAGGRATERGVTPGVRPGLTLWLGIAASIAVVALISVAMWPKRGAAANELTAFAFDDVRHGQHGGHGKAAGTLQAELSATSTHLAEGVPMDFATLAQTGCRTLKVAGHDVLEVCFVRNGAEFHCYIARAGDFKGLAGEGMTFVERAGLTAAAWSKSGHQFVVVTEAGLDAVKRLL